MRDRRKGGAKAPQNTQPQGLAALVTSFLERLSSRDYSQPSIDAHRWALRQFTGWADARGEHDPATFTRADLESYQLFLHHYRSPRGGKPLVTNTQVARLGCVRRFFAWLCRDGLIPANPAADLDLPRKQARQLPKNLSEQEIQLLLAIPNTADPFGMRDRTILELFYATGVRRTEMTQLDHGDYDPSAQTLLIRKGKNGKSRLLPVGERAASWLDRYLAEIRPLFDYLPNETALFITGYGTRYTPAYLGNWVAKLLKKAGIDKPGACHLLRHSCATDMHIGGADIRFVQEMLGHARLETTQIYTHVNISALQEVHARTHPHGILKDDTEYAGPQTSSVAEDFQNEEISASNLSPDLLDVNQEMPAVLTPLTVNTIPVSYRIPEEDSGPDEDDFPPESGPSTPPKRPGPQYPKNPHNSLASSALERSDDRLERGRVTYYQYRWYDPMSGRWASRDPIGERVEKNLYEFVYNAPLNWIDVTGRFPEPPYPKQDPTTGTYIPVPTKGGQVVAVDRSRRDAFNRPLQSPIGVYVPDGGELPDSYDDIKRAFINGIDSMTCGLYKDSTCECEGPRIVNDPYPPAARNLCKQFLERYQYSEAVIGNAICLARAEVECSKMKCCSSRNLCRIKAHFYCYASQGFIPILWMPEGGPDVGWNMLLSNSACK